MSITIGGIEFDHHSYDERGDVLYLSVGELKITWPEGHIRPEQLAPALAPAA
jgi:hypothetical protein